MTMLSYQEEQIALALARYSPQKQLLFAIGICKRLISLYGITNNPLVLNTCLQSIENGLENNRLSTSTMDIMRAELQAALSEAQADWARECVHAFMLLLDATISQELRLETVLEILSTSREVVELVAWENLGLAAWDKHGDEKIRQHPLVQSELEELYNDLKRIWNLTEG